MLLCSRVSKRSGNQTTVETVPLLMFGIVQVTTQYYHVCPNTNPLKLKKLYAGKAFKCLLSMVIFFSLQVCDIKSCCNVGGALMVDTALAFV